MSDLANTKPTVLVIDDTPENLSLLSNLLQLRRLSQRPLPTQMGDGTYRQVVQRPGFRADLRTVSLAGE